MRLEISPLGGLLLVGFGISLVVLGFLVGTYFGARLEPKGQNGDFRGALQEEETSVTPPSSGPKPLTPSPMTLPKDREGLSLYPLGLGEPHTDMGRTPPPPSDGAKLSINRDNEVSRPYTVQVGAFKVRTQATLLAKALKGRGLSPFLERYEAKDGLWYRVRVGRFKDQEKAKFFLVKVRNTYPKAYLARVEDESAIEGLE